MRSATEVFSIKIDGIAACQLGESARRRSKSWTDLGDSLATLLDGPMLINPRAKYNSSRIAEESCRMNIRQQRPPSSCQYMPA